MPDVVICEPLRTPVGRFGGMFKDLGPETLAATVITELVARTGISGSDIDDVILGQGYPSGEAPAIGRVAALDAGLGIDVPGLQVDRRCGSGLQAVVNAVLQVSSGGCDLVLAGGAESMSQAEFYATGMRWGVKGEGVSLDDRLARARVTAGGKNFPVPGGMIETAENLRAEYRISRADQDALAVQSHQRAVAAQKDGGFAEEIVPVAVPQRKSRAAAGRHRRAPARRHRPGVAGQAAPDPREDRSRIHRHRRQRERPERRRRAVHRHHRREGAAARAATAGPDGELGRRRRAAAHHGHRSGARLGEGARPHRPHAGGHGPHRAQRGLRRPGAGRACTAWGVDPTDERLNATAPASRSAIRSAPPAPASSRPCCASWSGARPATGSRPCASAAARASRRCSSGCRRSTPTAAIAPARPTPR